LKSEAADRKAQKFFSRRDSTWHWNECSVKSLTNSRGIASGAALAAVIVRLIDLPVLIGLVRVALQRPFTWARPVS
jgi:hypothetical protein